MSEEAVLAADARPARSALPRFARPLVITTAVLTMLALGFGKLQRDSEERAILTKALVVAVQNEDAGQVERLLDKGADANVRIGEEDPVGFLARLRAMLHLRDPQSKKDPLLLEASTRRNARIVLLLLERGADPTVPGGLGDRPLQWVARNGDTRSALVMLERGADPNSRDVIGNAPIHQALEERRYPMMRLLLEHGADPDLAHRRGVTPLMEAAARNDLEAARILLEHQADVNRRDEDGRSALAHARESRAGQVEGLLRQHGAKE